jgi:hypothetical protein
MIFQADHYVTGKNPHIPCADAALSSPGPIPFAVVADGCSASPESNSGAQILASATRRELSRHGVLDVERFGGAVLRRTVRAARALSLPVTALDATLIAAAVRGDGVTVFAFGDGVIAARRREDGETETIRLHYDSGAPFYLAYRLNSSRRERYRQEFPGHLRIFHDGEEIQTLDATTPATFHFPISDYDRLLIASDGLDALTGPEGPLPVEAAVETLTAFKTTAGAFLQRRARRALADWKRAGIAAADDLSIAALLWEEES